MFEKEPFTDAAVQKMDFLLNYDMFKILPDIEGEACCIRYFRISQGIEQSKFRTLRKEAEQ
ncbi:hypothetical protein [Anaeropeptidivorans aminofermentans]|uniref:hypothetical protein n=1 Tax=Anaeropeptidivorans aminofermentans TaxID=2934315 RepID=UPI0020249EA5|nr:hypothetical protein [Anaeropeptidivorans aminofermentans]